MNQRTNIKDAGTYVFIELFNNIDELNSQHFWKNKLR